MAPTVPALVAPAGSPGALQAAIRHGADAVYLGLRHLSARAHATNFALEQLGPAVRLAHDAGCEVLVTLNTLLRGDELELAARLLQACDDAGVDAVVLQDLGVLELACRVAPRLRLHGSTQLAIHDADGAAAAAALGLSRVVLARELSLTEIGSIHRQVPEIELEVFAHGSLCYAYSGLCLASAMAEERRRGRSSRGRSSDGSAETPSLALASERCFSGNRGRCTQPCRRPFHSADRELGLPFSLRDLLSLDLMEDLVDAGVTALKIEGRLRSPAFVAAVCHAYRGALDLALGREPPPGWQRDEAELALRSLFSRRASTGYLVGARKGAEKGLRHPPVQVQPLMQGHLGPRVGTVLQAGPDHTLASALQPFALGDKLLAADPEGRLRHLELRWMRDTDGRDITLAEAGQTVLIPSPGRFEVGVGQELRLAHSPRLGARFELETPTLLPEDYRGPPVDMAITTTREGLTIGVRCEGVEVRDQFQLGPEPVDALRIPTITEVMRTPGDATILGPVECLVVQQEPLLTPRKALRRVRRDILRRLELALELRRLTERYPALPVPPGGTPTARSRRSGEDDERWVLRSDQPELLLLGAPTGFAELEIVLDPAQPKRLDQALDLIPSSALACVLPPVLRGGDRGRIGEQIQRARDNGVRRWVLSNLGHGRLVDARPHERVEGDDLLYAANPLAQQRLQAALGLVGVTLPLELDRPCVEAMLHAAPSSTVVLYADVAVFRSALPPHLPDLPLEAPIADELEHPYHRGRQGRSAVLVDGVPLCLAPWLDPLRSSGAHRFRVDLCWRSYGEPEARAVLATVRAGQPVLGAGPGGWPRRWL